MGKQLGAEKKRSKMSTIKTGHQIVKNIKNIQRLREIVSVFAYHGFRNLLERLSLGQHVLSYFKVRKDVHKMDVAQRLRSSLEELGPSFVKLGQILSSQPQFPKEWAKELKKLHDNVQPLAFKEVKEILETQYEEQGLSSVFREINETPLASASISQVHEAILCDGQEVVLKVRRPHIIKVFQDDVNLLYVFAKLLVRYVPESHVYNPMALVEEFATAVKLETNFIVEANNILRFQNNMKDNPQIHIPHVYMDLTCESVLVMEKLKGLPLNHPNSLNIEGFEPKEFVRQIFHTFVKMVFTDRFFHGDWHPGNIFVMPGNGIGFVDFGLVGRLSPQMRDSLANIYMYLIQENYDRLAYELIDVSPCNEQNKNISVEKLRCDLQSTVAPYIGVKYDHLLINRVVMDVVKVASQHHLQVPSELMLYFRAILTKDGVEHHVCPDFDVLNELSQTLHEIVKSKQDTQTYSTESDNLRTRYNACDRELATPIKALFKTFLVAHTISGCYM